MLLSIDGKDRTGTLTAKGIVLDDGRVIAPADVDAVDVSLIDSTEDELRALYEAGYDLPFYVRPDVMEKLQAEADRLGVTVDEFAGAVVRERLALEAAMVQPR